MIHADFSLMTLYFRSELMCTDCLQHAYMYVRWSPYGLFYIICIFCCFARRCFTHVGILRNMLRIVYVIAYWPVSLSFA